MSNTPSPSPPWNYPRHFALDFSEDMASVGVVLSNPGNPGEPYTGAVVTNSIRPGFFIEKKTIEGLCFVHPPTPERWLADRWPGPIILRWFQRGRIKCVDEILAYVEPPGFAKLWGENAPYDMGGRKFSRVLDLITKACDRLFEFPDPHARTALACWIVATYFHPLFNAFPLVALSGEARSGKSKVLEFVEQVAFNGLRLLSPSPAAIYRMQERLRPTLCVDERDVQDRSESALALKALLNAGYRKGNCIPRVNMDKDGVVEMFDPYGPKIVAGITPLNSVTESRAIILPMVPGTDPDRINASVTRDHFGDLIVRALSYDLLLTEWRDVKECIQHQEHILPSWLTGRDREVWLPLLVMAHLADAETYDEERTSHVTELLAYARQQIEQYQTPPVSSDLREVLEKLALLVAKGETWHGRPSDLLPAWRPEKVASALRRLGFGRAAEGEKGSYYEITPEGVAAAYRRFGLPIPEELSQVVSGGSRMAV